MIDGNPNDFLDTMLWGDQIVFKYNDVDYCYMGKQNGDNEFCMEIVEYNKENPSSLWSFSGEHSDDGLQNFNMKLHG